MYTCITWINLTTINQDKVFCNASSVWGSLVKSYPPRCLD